MTAYQHQMGTDAADGASAIGAVRRLACSAHKFQPTSKVQSTGGRVISLTLAIPTGPTGGVRPVLFIPALARRVSSHGCCDRQRAGVNPLCYRLSAAFICRCRLARGPQFGFPQHVSGKSSNAAKSHVVNASLVRWFNANRHSERHDGTLPDHPREIQKRNGAPQHECC